jgi:uncharacterized protein (DUF1778 family)
MAITIRLNEQQEQQMKEAMELTGQATKSKAVLYLIENAKDILKNDTAFKRIKAHEEDIKLLEKKIAKLKAGK